MRNRGGSATDVRANSTVSATSNGHVEFPNRLEHSYYSDKAYWSFGDFQADRDSRNTTIHPRISWKVSKTTSTALPILSTSRIPQSRPLVHVPNDNRWVWSTAATTIITTSSYERLTHTYDTEHGQGTRNQVHKRFLNV